MERITNCKNCGAPLHYDKTSYGKTAKCQYCDTQYHIDLLGRVEEYKVKIEIMGQIREYYIGSWEAYPLFDTEYWTLDGILHTVKPIYKTKLELIEM